MSKKPNFLIVGAPKCGSTSLYSYLCEHPNIYMPEIKEPGFLIKEYYNNVSKKSLNYDRQRQYLTLNEKEYFNLFTDANQSHKCIGEASITYFYRPDLAISNIKKYLGKDIKIIIILRDPIKRAISQYNYINELGYEKLTFSKALLAEEDRLSENLSSIYAYKAQGLYHEAVKKFSEAFENVFITTQDKLLDNRNLVMNQLFNFLEVDPIEFKEETIFNKSGIPQSRYFHNLIMNKNSFRTLGFKVLKQFISHQKIKKIQNKLRELNHKMKQEIHTDEDLKYLNSIFNEDVKKLEAYLDMKFKWEFINKIND